MEDPDLPEDLFDELARRFSDFYAPGERTTTEFLFSRKLIVGARRWVTYIDRAIQQATGQTRARWETLFAINFAEPPVTTVGLARQVGVRWPTLVRTLGNLEADGLIEKADNPEDGRSRFIRLTPKGQAMFQTIRAMLDPERSRVLTGLTEAEMLYAIDVIDRFQSALTPERDGSPADQAGGAEPARQEKTGRSAKKTSREPG